MNSFDYLEAVISRHKLPSDYAAAKLIGTTSNTPRNWRAGKSMSDKHARAVAHLLEIPEAIVLLDVAAERATTDESKIMFSEMADSLRNADIEKLPPRLAAVLDGSVYIMLSSANPPRQIPLALPVRQKPRPHVRLAYTSLCA